MPPDTHADSPVGDTGELTTPNASRLLANLRYVATLLAELPSPPTEAVIAFRRADGMVEMSTIGECLQVGRSFGTAIGFTAKNGMSRQHFEIKCEGKSYLLKDLDSRNGTFVRGIEEPIKIRELREGDIIHAGGITFVFLRGT